MKLEEMERNELLDFFITRISGHEKEVETAHILAVHAAIKLPLVSAAKYEVDELDTDELIDLVEKGVLDLDGDIEEEERAWNLILDSLHPEKIFDIIENTDGYMKLYARMMQPIGELRESMLKNYVSIGGCINE